MKVRKFLMLAASVGLVFGILSGCGGGGGSSSSSSSDPVTQVEVEYKSEYFNNDGYFNAVTHSVDQTTASLVQAIYAINTFLYTDPEVTPYETFIQRKVDVDKALDVLITFSEETLLIAESVDDNYNDYIEQKALLRVLTPEDVDAITNSGNPMKPIATLMEALNVNAKTAKKILDDAMNDLSSNYQADAAWYDTAARTAELVKNTADLALVVGGTLMSGGAAVIGETALISSTTAAVAVITGLDASIKVAQSGVELAVSQDIDIEGSNIGYVASLASSISEIVGIKDFIHSESLFDNIIYLIRNNIDSEQDIEINFDSESVTISEDVEALLLAIKNNPPLYSAFVGSYFMADGSKVEVDKIDATIQRLLEKLDDANKIDEVKKFTLSCDSDQKVLDGTCVDKTCLNDVYNCPLCQDDEELRFNEDGSGYCTAIACEPIRCCAALPKACESWCTTADDICEENPTAIDVGINVDIDIPGYVGAFTPVLEATRFVVEDGEPGIVAMSSQNVDEADMLLMRFGSILEPGKTYTIVRPEEGPPAWVGFDSPQLVVLDDDGESDKIGFVSVSGSLTIEKFGTSVGDEISGSFDVGVEDYYEGTGITGNISGTFSGVIEEEFITQ
ncbi:MAG: hypothetical protein U9R28_02695 [Pseudomonadota bacterium]|nr:hypothetical protein [Pseudomonadota bacterium]